MNALLVAATVASLTQAQVPPGLSRAASALIVQAPIGGGCTPGDVRTCSLSQCDGAQQVCQYSTFGGRWGTCTCAVAHCTSTPCVNSSLAWDVDGWICASSPAPPGTVCANQASCTGSDKCDGAGSCVLGAPLALSDTNPATYDYCAAGLVSHAAVAPGGAAQPSGQVYASAGTPANPLAHSTPHMPTVGAPAVNENKGTLHYDYAFDLPKARGKFQPSLALSYSSASLRNEGAGLGWSLSAFFIEAEPAAPLIDDPPNSCTMGGCTNPPPTALPRVRWWLNFGHSRRRLLPVAPGSASYQTDLQGPFVSIVADADGVWRATDVSGSQYVFGHRVARAGTSDWTGRYYLARVADVDGNTTVFNYFDPASSPGDFRTAHELVSILYNNYVNGSTLYATTVALGYTELQPARYPRVADSVVKRSAMLASVSIQALPRYATTQSPVEVLRNELGYRRLQQGDSLVLSDVTVKAGGASLPPVRFGYSELPGGYELADGADLVHGIDASLSGGFRSAPGWDAEWIDVDGDGLVDRISGSAWKWQRNVTVPGALVPSFAAPLAISSNFAPFTTGVTVSFGNVLSQVKTAALVDFGGDGIVDIVTTKGDAHCEYQVVKGQMDLTGNLAFNGAPQNVECLDAYSVRQAMPAYFEFALAWGYGGAS